METMMALSNKAKLILKDFLIFCKDINGIDHMVRQGPVKIVDGITKGCTDGDPDKIMVEKEVKENRQEAEKIVAGFLGMM
jgi:hypothetical protein